MIKGIAKNAYNTLSSTGKNTVSVFKACTNKVKAVRDKAVASDTFQKASKYKHKDAILGAVVLGGALMLAIKCIKEMHNKIKEIKEE